MLDGEAICPSQSPWCNAVVLVRKKDESLWFCIDFCKLNEWTKKDAYPLLRMQEQMESMVRACHFSYIDLKSSFWQVKMAKESCQYTAFTVGSMRVYKFLRMPFGLCNAPCNLSTAHAGVFRGIKPHLCFDLPGQCHSLLKDTQGTPHQIASHLREIP